MREKHNWCTKDCALTQYVIKMSLSLTNSWNVWFYYQYWYSPPCTNNFACHIV